MRLTFRNRPEGRPAAAVKAGPSDAPHFELGRRGESMAVTHLERAGYRIVAANFNLPIGRNRRDVTVSAEIDLVAYDGPTLCFIEVKTRASDELAPPQANVDLRKRRQIARAARGYRRMLGLTGSAYRYDVVTVVWPGEREQIRVEQRIQLLKSFWTDEQLRKKSWYDARWD
jgi:putative endonuclease